MGISRDSRHKRRNTGGKRHCPQQKKLREKGHPPANTKLGAHRVRLWRTRGGNKKHRALRLEVGNFSWGSETIARKTRILDVLYNATNNELVRTKTLVKGCIVQIDSVPFKQWYDSHYGVEIGKKKGTVEHSDDVKRSGAVEKKIKKRQGNRIIDPVVEEQFASGKLLAAVSSRPGQCGRADGYVLEGKELEFYKRALNKKKKGKHE